MHFPDLNKIYENYSKLSQQGILLLLKMALIFNKQLLNFKPEQNPEILKEDWNHFLMSENFLILNNLLKQDRGCLNEFIKEFNKDKEIIQFDKNMYHELINQFNMNRLLKEIQQTFSSLLKLFSQIYDQMGEYKKGYAILYTYFYQAYSLNSDDCIFHTFQRFQDYWAYYEEIEQNQNEQDLCIALIQIIQKL